MSWWARRRGPAPEVVVYTRAGCGLCRVAEEVAGREARRAGAPLRLVDVDADPDVQRRYHVRVPVVAVAGEEVAEVELAPGTVTRAIARARRAGVGGRPRPR